jgi:hypothetical protein
MKILIGHTGFVGSNIAMKHEFDRVFNSKNVHQAYGLKPEICVYSGVRAQKTIANMNPKEDRNHIEETKYNLLKIQPKKLVLISTIDVLSSKNKVDEDYVINTKILEPYGYNRLELEKWVQFNFSDVHIVRLPSLYGMNLKKNFIYDLINPVPNLLNNKILQKLNIDSSMIEKYYDKKDDGFYHIKQLNERQKSKILKILLKNNFSSKDFTDSRSEFQFYPLDRIWNDIVLIIKKNIKIMNLVTEPIKVSEIFFEFFKANFKNEIREDYPKYDVYTKYSKFFGNSNFYIVEKKQILDDLMIYLKQNL